MLLLGNYEVIRNDLQIKGYITHECIHTHTYIHTYTLVDAHACTHRRTLHLSFSWVGMIGVWGSRDGWGINVECEK